MKDMTSTQRKATAGTYRRLATMIASGKRVLDYGAGLCHGAEILGADTFEPCPQVGVEPTYTKAADIPYGVYDAVVCNCVLNVIASPEARQGVIKHIVSLLRPNGIALIMVRSHADIRGIKHATPEGDGVRTSTGSFQRGFTHQELTSLVPGEVKAEKLDGISSIGILLTVA